MGRYRSEYRKNIEREFIFDQVLGSDLNDDHAAKFIYDDILKLPLCSSGEYFECLQKIIEKLSIDFLLPISEPELRIFTEKK